ncbi:glycosyltransferase family 25 protein [uncultured Agrobacterium sp.]|uniref:glycosyltransferase family 25 protein n=1 Tax=uncultured Agrobacterium sp. TaxID=157277 RepID=UPI0025E9AA6E|nr:glycosyltransferase family 25 protein [uncultured Agrobacterium sp.]
MHLFEKPKKILAVYLINMADAHERRLGMSERLSAIGLTAERIEAVDGRALTFPIPQFSGISYKLLHGRRTCPPEVGCYLSHVECARRLLRSGADFALILEDDVIFHDDFLEAVEAAVEKSGSWDILRLSTVNSGRKYPFQKLTAQRALAIAMTREKGAGAYVINRRAAQWISTDLVPMRLAYDIAFDTEYLAGLKAAFIYPVCATQHADARSQIQDNVRSYRLPGWRYLTVLPYRAYLEIARFLCRGFRLLQVKTIGFFSRSVAQRPVQPVMLPAEQRTS